MSALSQFIIVAVDGGAATGKSSTSRAVAERLDLMHVDTGAHYRSLTFALLKIGASATAPERIGAYLDQLEIGTVVSGRSACLRINGAVPADADIRSPEVNASVSQFAAVSEVREFLFAYQRSQVAVARENNFAGMIMEGRDIGSVILPDADFRFFLFADEVTRAARRAKEGLTDSIAARDQMDSNRKTAPLLCPEGAIRVDTGPRSLEAVIDLICEMITAG